MDQRSNAYGQGAGWPPGLGADVAYPIDEHPSHPPAPWGTLPADPAACGIDPASVPSWDTGSWAVDPGPQQATAAAEPGWDRGGRGGHEQSHGDDHGQGYSQGYDQRYDQGYDQGPRSAGTGAPRPWQPVSGGQQPGATYPGNGNGNGNGYGGHAAGAAGSSQAAKATGHDLGPITGPWPAVPDSVAPTGYTAPAPAPAADQVWDQGANGNGYGHGNGNGYPSANGNGYAGAYEATVEAAPGWDQHQGQGWDQGGNGWADQPGYAGQTGDADQGGYAHQGGYADPQEGYADHAGYADQGAYADQGQGWNQQQQQAQQWEQAGDQDWGDGSQAGWAEATAAAPAWGQGGMQPQGDEWGDEASFDAAFGENGDQWGPEDGERQRPSRGLVLILAVALVVLLGAVAGATWALTTRNPGGTAPKAAAAAADGGGNVAGGTPGEAGGAQEGAANQVETAEFSFAAPKGWQDITERAKSASSVGNRVVTALAHTTQDGTGSSIVVTAGPNETGSEPSIAALGQALKSRTQSEGATKVSNPKPLNLADGDAVAVDYEGELRGSPIAGRRVLAIHGDKAYVLVIEGSGDRFKQDLGAFEEVLASWNWAS